MRPKPEPGRSNCSRPGKLAAPPAHIFPSRFASHLHFPSLLLTSLAQPSRGCVRGVALFDITSDPYLDDLLRRDRLVPSATLRIQKLEQFLKGPGIRRISQERALAPHIHQAFI